MYFSQVATPLTLFHFRRNKRSLSEKKKKNNSQKQITLSM